MEIFDVSGRRIQSIPNLPSGPGWHEVTWDGRSEAGDAMASGRYFARLTVGEAQVVTHVTLVR
jgi:hypothetical protein